MIFELALTFCFLALHAVHAIEVLRLACTGAGGDGGGRRLPDGAGANGRRSGLGMVELLLRMER